MPYNNPEPHSARTPTFKPKDRATNATPSVKVMIRMTVIAAISLLPDAT
jgi:hypothetical protein